VLYTLYLLFCNYLIVWIILHRFLFIYHQILLLDIVFVRISPLKSKSSGIMVIAVTINFFTLLNTKLVILSSGSWRSYLAQTKKEVPMN
jgi:hypothetical protein